MSDSADAICNDVNHAEEVERREASPLTASKAGKGGTLPFLWGRAVPHSLESAFRLELVMEHLLQSPIWGWRWFQKRK